MEPAPSSARSAARTSELLARTIAAAPRMLIQVENLRAAMERHDPAWVARIVAGLREGDPLADAVVAAFATRPRGEGFRLLERALASGPSAVPEAPPALRELLDAVFTPPSWVDLDRVDDGARAYWRLGALHTCSLALALLYGYQYRAFARTLVLHGRIHKVRAARWEETGRWFLAASAPGLMRPGAAGFALTVRIRLIHALVRAELQRSSQWDLEVWGEPINASYNGATASVGFMLMPLRAMIDAGVDFTADEREAIAHQWAWIGHVMCATRYLLCATVARAEDLLDLGRLIATGPDENSRALAAALVRDAVRGERALPPILRRFARPVARAVMSGIFTGVAGRWIDVDLAQQLDLPRSALRHVVPLTRPLVRARELARKRGLLGSPAQIAEVQRSIWLRGFDAVRAVEQPMGPDDVAAVD